MRMHTVTPEQLLAMNAQRERCVLEIGDANVDTLLYACLVAIMVTGPGALRPVTPQEDLDAQLTIEALCQVTVGQAPSMDELLTRKAELIVERAAGWERSHPGWRETDEEMV